MGKYHHNARFEDHVITNVCVVTSHHHHRLLPGNPPSCVLLILPVKDKDQFLYHVFESLDFHEETANRHKSFTFYSSALFPRSANREAIGVHVRFPSTRSLCGRDIPILGVIVWSWLEALHQGLKSSRPTWEEKKLGFNLGYKRSFLKPPSHPGSGESCRPPHHIIFLKLILNRIS